MLHEKNFSLEELFSEIAKNNLVSGVNPDIELFKKNSPDILLNVDKKLKEIKDFLNNKKDQHILSVIDLQKLFEALTKTIDNDEDIIYNQVYSAIEEIYSKYKIESDYSDYDNKMKLSESIVSVFNQRKFIKTSNINISRKKKKNNILGIISFILASISMVIISKFGAIGLLLFTLSMTGCAFFLINKKGFLEEENKSISTLEENEKNMNNRLDKTLVMLGIQNISEFRYLSQQLFVNQEERIEFIKKAIEDDNIFKNIDVLKLVSENGIKQFNLNYSLYEKRKNTATKDLFKSDALKLIKNMDGEI